MFQIIRTHHKKKPLAVVKGSRARATIEYWPVHSDIVRYESLVGRLQVNARAASIVEFYRRAFGAALFGDDTFFSGTPAYDLRALQNNRPEVIANHGVYGIGHVWMTECLWEHGDRQLLHIRAHDCFSYINERNIPISERTILLAKLKLQVAGKSTRPVTLTIRVPSTLESTQKQHGVLVERFADLVALSQQDRHALPEYLRKPQVLPRDRGAEMGLYCQVNLRRRLHAHTREEPASARSRREPSLGRRPWAQWSH